MNIRDRVWANEPGFSVEVLEYDQGSVAVRIIENSGLDNEKVAASATITPHRRQRLAQILLGDRK